MSLIEHLIATTSRCGTHRHFGMGSFRLQLVTSSPFPRLSSPPGLPHADQPKMRRVGLGDRWHNGEMPEDPLVLLAFAELPEIADLPEWSELRARYQDHGFDIDQLLVTSLAYEVLNPWLSRLLDDTHGTSVLTRLFTLVEGIITSGDQAGSSSMKHLVEYGIFRTGRERELAGVIGPTTENHLAELHEKWRPWNGLIEFLTPCLTELVSDVKAAHPQLHGGTTVDVDLGANRFTMYASFMYRPAVQRFEDLLAYFAVDRANVAQFELSRGCGELLAPEFPSVVLEGEPGMASYEASAREFAEASMAFARESLPLLLPALEPYDEE